MKKVIQFLRKRSLAKHSGGWIAQRIGFSALVLALVCATLVGTSQDSKTVQLRIENANDLMSKRGRKGNISFQYSIPSNGSTERQVSARSATGKTRLIASNYEGAEVYLEGAGKSYSLIFNEEGTNESVYRLARMDALAGNFEGTMSRVVPALYRSRQAATPMLEFNLRSLLSWAQFETEADFNVVLENERRLSELATAFGDDSYKAEVYNNLGYDLAVSGTADLDSAIGLTNQANEIYAAQQESQGRWYTLMNLCWQYRLQGDFQKSAELGKLSVEQALRDNDRHAIIETSIQMGESLIELARFPEAGDYFNTALDWSFKDNDRDKFMFDIYYGKYLYETGSKREGVSLIESAVNYLEASEVFYEMHGRALLSSYYLDMGMQQKAEEQLQIIEYPRRNYIAFETLFLAACSRAIILHNQKQGEAALALLDEWSQRACTIGSGQLVLKAREIRSRIFSAG